MKIERHAKIIELINQYAIETQEELAGRLNEAGFRVTQATVSRDIRELKLTKMTVEGKQRYVVVPGPGGQLSGKYIGILRESFVSMDMAQNILVIKTVAGMAMAASGGPGWPALDGDRRLYRRRRYHFLCSTFCGRYHAGHGEASQGTERLKGKLCLHICM